MRCAPGQGTQTTLTFRFGAEWALAYEMPGSAWVPIASTLPVRAYLELQRVEVGLKGIVMGGARDMRASCNTAEFKWRRQDRGRDRDWQAAQILGYVPSIGKWRKPETRRT
jgi:hypothetical protein